MSLRLRCSLVALLFAVLVPSAGYAQAPTVRAVLFYSPTCPHCQIVITETLPPLFETYGDQLQIVGIDISTPEGQGMYLAVVDAFALPDDRRGVPMLVLGQSVLIGSIEIPGELPALIEAGLAAGGVDWPSVPGLAEALATDPAQATSDPGTSQPEPTSPSVGDRVLQDPVGNTLSILVLIGMTFSLIAVGARWNARTPAPLARPADWLIPLLSAIGLLVAIYLTTIELSGEEAFCGPVGDCNAVQQSTYAFLFGILPIGMLGMLGYAAFILVWAATRLLTGRALHLARLSLLAMAVFGTLFSVYLTFLEPFVIGATCAWCLTSAVLMTILMWLTLDPARAALARLQGRRMPAPRRRSA